jgi:hypothetical protein
LFFANLRSWYKARTSWELAALAVWGAILLGVSVRVFLAPESKTVYPIFSASGRFWWTGTELYEPYRPTNVQDGYRYSPVCAILFTPFAIFPDAIGGILWRLFSAAALVGALAWFARSVLTTSLTPNPSPGGRGENLLITCPSRNQFAGMLLLVIALLIQSVSNGQANLVVIAAMLGCVAAVREERWTLGSALLAVAFVFKLYPLALGMVLILLYPRQLWWRIPTACLAGLAAPFLLQHPAYVLDQYAHWIELVRAEDRSDINLDHMYRDLWLLIHLYGVPISRSGYVLIQIAGGALVAFESWRRQRAGWPTPALLTSTLALTTAWMMLLGPATESSSFALLAPSFAWSVVEALNTRPRTARHGLLWGTCAIFAIAVIVGGIFSDWRLHQAGVHAWGSLCYFAYLLTERRAPAAQEALLGADNRLAA